jgi:hypothetical protein
MARSLGQDVRALRGIAERGDRSEEHDRHPGIPNNSDRAHAVLEFGKVLNHAKGFGLVFSSLGVIQYPIRGHDPSEFGCLESLNACRILATHSLE